MKIHLSSHAVERYRDRFKEASSIASAHEDLRRLSDEFGVLVTVRPEFVPDSDEADSTAWLVIGEAIALPLVDMGNSQYTATTCLAKGSISPERRKRRNEAARRNRQRKHGRRIKR